jgi:hypothetical protein
LGIYVLFCHQRDLRAVGPLGVMKHAKERFSGIANVTSVLVVAGFVENEEKVDKVADGPELIVSGEWVCMRYEELALALLDGRGTAIVEYVVAFDPCSRFGRSTFPMRVGCVLERVRAGEEVGEDEASGGHWELACQVARIILRLYEKSQASFIPATV